MTEHMIMAAVPIARPDACNHADRVTKSLLGYGNAVLDCGPFGPSSDHGAIQRDLAPPTSQTGRRQ
jgi:hypothetical protein